LVIKQLNPFVGCQVTSKLYILKYNTTQVEYVVILKLIRYEGGAIMIQIERPICDWNWMALAYKSKNANLWALSLGVCGYPTTIKGAYKIWPII